VVCGTGPAGNGRIDISFHPSPPRMTNPSKPTIPDPENHFGRIITSTNRVPQAGSAGIALSGRSPSRTTGCSFQRRSRPAPFSGCIGPTAPPGRPSLRRSRDR
jgi:hypothetical protein